MNFSATKHIVMVLIVFIVILISMQVVSGRIDTELAFVPQQGPSLCIDVRTGATITIDFTIGWNRPCGRVAKVEYLSAAIRTDPGGQD